MAKSFKNNSLTAPKIGWATPEFTPVDKLDTTPLVEALSRTSRNYF
jgi:hypothetical protein